MAHPHHLPRFDWAVFLLVLLPILALPRIAASLGRMPPEPEIEPASLPSPVPDSTLPTEHLCVRASDYVPDAIDSKLLRETGTALWLVEQKNRTCAPRSEECAPWSNPGRFIELAYLDPPTQRLARYAFSEPGSQPIRLGATLERGGLTELFRWFVLGYIRHTDGSASEPKRFAIRKDALLEEYELADAPAPDLPVVEYRLSIWKLELLANARYELRQDLSEACLYF